MTTYGLNGYVLCLPPRTLRSLGWYLRWRRTWQGKFTPWNVVLWWTRFIVSPIHSRSVLLLLGARQFSVNSQLSFFCRLFFNFIINYGYCCAYAWWNMVRRTKSFARRIQLLRSLGKTEKILNELASNSEFAKRRVSSIWLLVWWHEQWMHAFQVQHGVLLAPWIIKRHYKPIVKIEK